jgi:hypothetical protein
MSLHIYSPPDSKDLTTNWQRPLHPSRKGEMHQSVPTHLNHSNPIPRPSCTSILIGRFRRRRGEFPVIVSEPFAILLRTRIRSDGGRGRLRSVEAGDEVLQIRWPRSVGGEARGALVCCGRLRRRLDRSFLLPPILLVVVGAEQGERKRAPWLLPGGGGRRKGGRRGGVRLGSERARHEIAPVVVEGREGGRPGISEGRLRRGGEGEVAEIEVVVGEGRGGRRERDGVHGGVRWSAAGKGGNNATPPVDVVAAKGISRSCFHPCAKVYAGENCTHFLVVGNALFIHILFLFLPLVETFDEPMYQYSFQSKKEPCFRHQLVYYRL